MLLSCGTPKEQSIETQFISCLPSEAQNDFQEVINAFHRLLQRDYNGSIDSFTQTIVALNLNDKIIYSQEDISLGKRLMKNNFNQYVYSTYNDTTYHSVFSKIKGETLKKPRVRAHLRVDINKPYLSCLLKVIPKDDILRKYVEGQEINSVLIVIQDFTWKPGYDISTLSESGLLKVMLATELYSGMLMRSK